MQWDGEPPSLKDDRKPSVTERMRREGTEHTQERREEAQALAHFTSGRREREREKRELLCWFFFSMKKMCLFCHWINQRKQTRKSFENPSVETPVTEKSPGTERTRTLTLTFTHTSKHVKTEAAENTPPTTIKEKKKSQDSETCTPTTAYEALLHCWRRNRKRKKKKIKLVRLTSCAN